MLSLPIPFFNSSLIPVKKHFDSKLIVLKIAFNVLDKPLFLIFELIFFNALIIYKTAHPEQKIIRTKFKLCKINEF